MQMRLRLKRGDSLIWGCTRTDVQSLLNVTPSCQMRKLNNVVNLVVTVTNSAKGEFSLYATPQATSQMEAGIWEFDVQFVDDITGAVISTETHTCMIENDVTRG